MKKICFLLFVLFFFQKSLADELTGYPKIIDGDTIHINSLKIRLEDIDAPEIKQLCKKNYKEYFCGQESKLNLKKKIGKMKVICKTSSKDKYRRFLATCFSQKINLNKWMVKNGYAIAYRRYSKKYVVDEDYAKKNKLGIWSGIFIKPEKWRKLN